MISDILVAEGLFQDSTTRSIPVACDDWVKGSISVLVSWSTWGMSWHPSCDWHGLCATPTCAGLALHHETRSLIDLSEAFSSDTIYLFNGSGPLEPRHSFRCTIHPRVIKGGESFNLMDII
jgi:hypothetical protein